MRFCTTKTHLGHGRTGRFLVLLFTIKSGKAPTVLTLTATLNRRVLACSGCLLRCNRRCHAPFIFYISYSLISINAGSFGGKLVNQSKH
jgi:uncharacterized metal-binding protein